MRIDDQANDPEHDIGKPIVRPSMTPGSQASPGTNCRIARNSRTITAIRREQPDTFFARNGFRKDPARSRHCDQSRRVEDRGGDGDGKGEARDRQDLRRGEPAVARSAAEAAADRDHQKRHGRDTNDCDQVWCYPRVPIAGRPRPRLTQLRGAPTPPARSGAIGPAWPPRPIAASSGC